MRALRVQSAGKASVVDDASTPTLRPGYILVKVIAVALNPTDYKHIASLNTPVTVGCDYSGIVVDVSTAPAESPDVKETAIIKTWRKGDRVCGVIHGSNPTHPEDGTFGEYVLALGALQMKIPDGMSFEEAATLGMGVSTVGQGFQAMGLPWPGSKTDGGKILVYGGSSAMGAYGIQLFKSIGFEVFTTCSPKNSSYVKSIGADDIFDYNSPTCGADIRKASGDKLYYAWDAIGEGNSPQICADALASDPSKGPNGKAIYCNILRARSPREDVVTKNTLMYSTFGEEYTKWGRTFPKVPEDKEYMKEFIVHAEQLIASGKLKPHRVEVRPGGLDGILGGLKDMSEGKVSGSKLVYKIANPLQSGAL